MNQSSNGYLNLSRLCYNFCCSLCQHFHRCGSSWQCHHNNCSTQMPKTQKSRNYSLRPVALYLRPSPVLHEPSSSSHSLHVAEMDTRGSLMPCFSGNPLRKCGSFSSQHGWHYHEQVRFLYSMNILEKNSICLSGRSPTLQQFQATPFFLKFGMFQKNKFRFRQHLKNLNHRKILTHNFSQGWDFKAS